MTSNPRELMIARSAADVIEHSGYFRDGFSLQTGSGAASTACTRFLESRMRKQNIVARFALGGITGSIVDLHEKDSSPNCWTRKVLMVPQVLRLRKTRTMLKSQPAFMPILLLKQPAAIALILSF